MSQKQLTPFENKPQLVQEMLQQERFTNRSVNIIVLTITFIAYLPLLINPVFYDKGPLLVSLILIIGVLYAFNGTMGMMWIESHLPQHPWILALFFTPQLILIALSLYLVKGLDHNMWLLILPLTAQSLALPRWGTAVVSLLLLSTIYFLYLEGGDSQEVIMVLLSIGAAMLFTLLFTQIALREAGTRAQIQQLARELHKANLNLAAYATQAEELATTKERNRLAREIHDNLGHYLTVINVQIEAARLVMETDPAKARDSLQKAQNLTQEGLNAIRHSISSLRESPLENQTLVESINKLAAETRNSGLITQVQVIGEVYPLEEKKALTLYRVTQEGLTNVRKHARASRVDITLDYSQLETVALTIEDNGLGTDTADSGFGLLGIRERLNLLDGNMAVWSAPGEGFCLQVTLPGKAGQDNGRK